MNLSSLYLPEILVKMRTGGATGESIDSIVEQNKEIFNALKQHEITYSKMNFTVHKIMDRIFQRLRAYFLKVKKTVKYL